MKKFTFRITQDLKAFYEGLVDIEASSEKAARNKLEKMSTEAIDKLVYDWEQNTDNASPEGEIEIQELKNEEDE